MNGAVRSWWSKLRGVPRRPRADEELAFHLAMETEANVRRGLDPEEAGRQARIRLGGVEQTMEAARDAWSLGRLEDLAREVRVAVRVLRRAPRFTLLVVGTLGLAIGASTALFAAFRQVVLPPLPYAGAERVVALWEIDVTSPGRLAVSPGNWVDWHERNRSFAALGLVMGHGVDLVGEDGRPQSHSAWLVSEEFFAATGARAAAGRLLLPEDFSADRLRVVGQQIADRRGVISYELWQRRFAGDPGIVDSRIQLEDGPLTIVGVLAPGFAYPDEADFWLQMPIPEYFRHIRVGNWLFAVGRLADGVSVARAQEDLDRVAAELAAEHPQTNPGLGVELVPIEQQVLGEARSMLAVLFGAVCLLLSISCATIAGLVLARSIERGGETAIRRALGASRRSLARQALVESALLAGGAAVLGAAVAVAALAALARTAPAALARLDGLRLDGAALVFTVLASAAVVAVAGLWPALHAAERTGRVGRGGGRATVGGGVLRLHRALTVTQIGVALVLLIGSGLLARSFAELLETDLGFRAEGLAALQAHLYDVAPSAEEKAAFTRRAIERFEALPGVTAAAASTAPPFHPNGIESREELEIPGGPAPLPGELRAASIDAVSPAFFATLGIPVVEGRGLTDRDRAGAPLVVVVNETLARALWPAGDAVGSRLSIGLRSAAAEREVVGVVADVRGRDHMTAPRPMAYFPLAQSREGSLVFVLRSDPDPARGLAAARRALAELAPSLAVDEAGTGTVDEMVADTLAPHRFYLLLLGGFSGVALLLALAGTYGLVSFTTARRTGEFGIRRVVGAVDRDLVRLVLRQTGLLIVGGLAVGGASALVLTRFLAGLLHGVAPNDPAIYAGLALLLGAVALLASWLPARRAAQRDPLPVLRTL